MSLHALLLALTCVAAADRERIRVGAGGRGFSLDPSGKPFTPWGLNYGNDGLIEDSWGDDWPKLVGHFEEMKARKANVARVHLQFGKFMDGPDRPIAKALDRLGKLLELAEEKGLYLDLTGLGCYRKANVPVWYDGLSEEDRWSAQARFWGAVAERCTKSPAVFCYDLMNEPFVPGEKRKPGEWYSGKPIGEYDFVQFITLDRGDRPREEVARRWVKRLARSIREHDPGHLITVGLLPWTFARGHLSGFVPEATRPRVGLRECPHLPGEGQGGRGVEGPGALRRQQTGRHRRDVSARCSAEDLEDFFKRSRRVACGWMGHYDGAKTIEELDALRKSKTITIGQAISLGWPELFRRLKPEMVP